jgi:acyl carrier protein
MHELGQEELVARAVNWVRKNSPEGNTSNLEITPDSDLLESGLLDSLGLVQLIAFMEEEANTKIDLLEIDPADFTTLRGLSRFAVESLTRETSDV